MLFDLLLLFFFNDPATTEIYTLSLHDALPISIEIEGRRRVSGVVATREHGATEAWRRVLATRPPAAHAGDRKSTRLNSSHSQISYAVFCLKKKKKTMRATTREPTL